MKQENILVTASDNIPYQEIEKQFGIVDSQIVVGANLFRDAFASFRDLLGGETKGYKKDIDKMKNAAISSIKSQAIKKGANAVIALKIDLDELSGGGKSMFMMNIYGSAVKLKQSALESDINTDAIEEFSFEDLEYFKEKNRLYTQIENCSDILKEVDLSSISKYKLWNKEISSRVLESSLDANHEKLEELNDNLSEIPDELLEEFLANKFDKIRSSLWDRIYNSFESRNWFNYKLIKKFLNDDSHIKRFRALQLCTLKKDFYERSESKELKELGRFITTDFNKNIPTKVVTKMINKKEVYVCPNCLKETDANQSYCECGANKKGLEPRTLTPESIGQDLIETAQAIELAFEDLN